MEQLQEQHDQETSIDRPVETSDNVLQMSQPTFTAKYQGTCPKCSKTIYPGQMVTTERPRGPRVHVDCAGGAVIEAKTEVVRTGGDIKADSALAVLANALIPLIDGHVQAAVSDDRIREIVEQMVPKVDLDAVTSNVTQIIETAANTKIEELLPRIANAIEPVVRKAAFEEAQKAGVREIVISIPQLDVKSVVETPHELFEQLLELVNLNLNVYLWGPAGSGKSTAASQVAKALGRNYGYISLDPQAGRSVLMGYMDVNGKYVRTPFRDAYEHGHVFCIDEADNASANLVVALNSALENGHCAFPDAIIAKHPNFVLVATGNTAGRGGDPRYANRRPFDPAFADRFVFLKWDYDKSMERKVAVGINPKSRPWITWVQSVRDYCDANKIDRIVTPRATLRGALLLKTTKRTVEEVAEMLIFRGLDKSTTEKIVTAKPYPAIEREE